MNLIILSISGIVLRSEHEKIANIYLIIFNAVFFKLWLVYLIKQYWLIIIIVNAK